MKRRTFLAALGASAALPALAAGDAPAPAPKAGGKAAFVQPPTAQIVGEDALAVCWRSATPSAGTVFWTQDPALPRERWAAARRTAEGLVCSNRCDHLVTLRGVDFTKPLRFEAESVATTMDPWWTRFGERAASGVIEVGPIVRDGGALCFAVLNDLHANAALIPKLLSVPAVAAAKPAFVVLNGDCAGNCASPEALRKALLGPMAELTARGIPLLFVRGNHEYRGTMARRFREAFAPFVGTGAAYGALTLGGVRLLVLDSGEDKVDGHREYCGLLDCEPYIAEEGAWLRREVASEAWRTAAQRLAFCHIPPATGTPGADGRHGPARLREHMVPALAKGGLGLLISAHEHRASHLPAEGEARPYPTLIGGGPKEESATVLLVRTVPRSASGSSVEGPIAVFADTYRADGTALDALGVRLGQ